MRTIICLICIVWIVLMSWLFIHDDLTLAFYGQQTPATKFWNSELDVLTDIFPQSTPEEPWLAFSVINYRFTVDVTDENNNTKAQVFEGEDMYITDSVPDDLKHINIIYNPNNPEISKVQGHLELWPYGSALLALILWISSAIRRRVPTGTLAKARQPLKQFTGQFNQLKLKWDELAVKTIDKDMQQQAITWSNDVLILSARKDPGQLIALARVFIIYVSQSDPDQSKAIDATAVLKYENQKWDTAGELIQKLPQDARKKYPGFDVVHERIDENRNVLFEELLKRTAKPESIPFPELTPDEPETPRESDSSDQSKEKS